LRESRVEELSYYSGVWLKYPYDVKNLFYVVRKSTNKDLKSTLFVAEVSV
jgi:hypothetical protein